MTVDRIFVSALTILLASFVSLGPAFAQSPGDGSDVPIDGFDGLESTSRTEPTDTAGEDEGGGDAIGTADRGHRTTYPGDGREPPRRQITVPPIFGKGKGVKDRVDPNERVPVEGAEVIRVDPVDTARGDLHHRSTDLSWSIRGLDVTFGRFYRSGARGTRGFGPGWRHSYDWRIQKAAGHADLITGRGDRVRFSEMAGGGFVSMPGTGWRLHPAGAGYRLLDAKGLERIFDGSGRLVEIRDRTGARVRLQRDSRGYLEKVIDPLGRELNLTWKGSRLVSLRGPFGRTVQYGYDEAGRLSRVTRIDGGVVRHRYDDEGLLARIAYPGGMAVQYTHDAQGRVVRVSDGTSTYRLVYSPDGRSTTEIDPLGNKTILQFDDQKRLAVRRDRLGGITRFERDEAGNIVRVILPTGETFRYGYDHLGRRIWSEDPAGHRTTLTYEAASGQIAKIVDAAGAVREFGFDDRGRVISYKGPGGASYLYTRDERGDVSSVATPTGERFVLEHDQAGLLTRMSLKQGDRLVPVRSYGYTRDGRLAWMEDALGAQTRFETDLHGRLIGMTRADGSKWSFERDEAGRLVRTVSPLGRVWSREYRVVDFRYRIAALTEPGGDTWTFTHDLAGRLTAVTSPGGAGTRYEYDAEGHVIASIDPSGLRTHFERDGLGRLVARYTDPRFRTRYGYDARGLLASIHRNDTLLESFEHDPAGRLVEMARGGAVERIEYDLAGRITKHIDAGGAVRAYTYDARGRQTGYEDPAGGRWRYRYDALGRMVAQIDPLGGITEFERDAAGRLTLLRDPEGREYAYKRDLLGQVLSHTGPAGLVARLIRDAEGRVVRVEDASKQAVLYEWGPRGQVTSITRVLGDETVEGVDTFGYGPGGVLAWAENSTARIEFDHDRRGLPTRETLSLGDVSGVLTSGALLLQRGWSAEGRPLRVAGVAGTDMAFRHDGWGRLVGAKDGVAGEFALQWTPQDRLSRVDLPGGMKIALQLRPDGLLRSLVASLPASAGPVLELQYRYDPAGELSAETSPAGATRLAHDALGRLVSFSPASGPAERFSYDGSGNRLLKAVDGTRLASNLDEAGRPIRIGESPYKYDRAGRLASWSAAGEDHRLQYDVEGRLTGVRYGSDAPVTIRRGPLGRPLVIARGKKTTVQVFDGPNLLAQVTADGKTRRFLSLPGVLDGYLGEVRGGRDVSLYLSDRIGSVRKAVRPDGAVLGEVRYDAFGRARTKGRVPGVLFSGRPLLPGTDLYDFRNRTYQPATGRFTSPDPSGFRGGLNQYAYALNGPWTHRDPMGLEVLVLEMGAPSEDSNEHLWVRNLHRRYGGKEFSGRYSLDDVVEYIVKAGRRNDKISRIYFGGHIQAVQPDPEVEPEWHLLAGAAAYENSLGYDDNQFLTKLKAAMDREGLRPEDVFTPDMQAHFRMCFAGEKARPFMEELTRTLPPGAEVHAYRTPYVWRTAKAPAEFLLGGWLPETLRPDVRYHVGHQEEGLMIYRQKEK